ncbi:MAG: serine--tRNA ligase [Candidatus Aenigmatarchaeota archaeon]
MLDIKLIRENPEIIKENLRKRGDKEKEKLLDRVIELDKHWRMNIKELNELRMRRNKISEEIAKAKKEKKDIKELLEIASQIPERIKIIEEEIRKQESEIREILMRLPNLLHESVPIGKDDSENVEIRKFGKIPKFDFEPKHHQDIAEKICGIDMERAAKISGARFYFLKNPLVRLNFAILNYALDFISKKGFEIYQPPFMINRTSCEGVIEFEAFENMIYKIENEDLFLIATSEHPLISMFSGETFLEKELPKFIAGVSPCFRKEAGTHGKDEKGIFRVHQFEKVEQVAICKPEDSWDIHEKLLNNAEEFFKSLEIPFRVVNICTGDIGSVAAKKYDIEAWMPAQSKYREVVSCSNCTDYQARRLNIKWRKKEGAAPEGFVHTLNSTLVATERLIVAILENFQNKDGSVSIPKILQPYMNGIKKIGPTS